MYSKIVGSQYGAWFRSPFWHLKFGGDPQIFRMSVDLCCNQCPQTFASLACFQKHGRYNGIKFSKNLPLGLIFFCLPVNSDSYYHLRATWQKFQTNSYTYDIHTRCIHDLFDDDSKYEKFVPYTLLYLNRTIVSFNHNTKLLNAALPHYLSLLLLLKVLTSNDNCNLSKNKWQKMLTLQKKSPFFVTLWIDS